MSELFARKALLSQGWANNVRIVTDAGLIASVERLDRVPEDAHAIVVPGIVNAHSHAFQRALAGRAEHGQGEDSFWTWRHLMYALAARLDADALEAIARQLYAEMLGAGYTSVVEFHYLHRERDKGKLDGAMTEALARAASATGMRLIYAPVLYERADFASPDPTPEQARFAMTLNEYFEHVARIRDHFGASLEIALAAHSLRAVTPESLSELAKRSRSMDCPLHIHVAEQQREVDGCLAATGARPVQWLLEEHDVNERWNLVHATHLDAGECEQLAASGAVVVLCPSTEGNLGDGLFPLEDYLRHGGAIAIGSDSHVTINPFEEFRWLEYGQRLSTHRRNVAAVSTGHTGHDLFTAAQIGGRSAAGIGGQGLEPGAAADLVVLDDGHPALLGHGPATLLDALVFSAQGTPVEQVMVEGEWCVFGGLHRDQESIRERYAATIHSLDLAREA